MGERKGKESKGRGKKSGRWQVAGGGDSRVEVGGPPPVPDWARFGSREEIQRRHLPSLVLGML